MTRTHSRPHVSDDNPYSEAAFKTLKYAPDLPARFGSIDDARAFMGPFIERYNHGHRHSGIGYHTPASVHRGTVVREQRAKVSTPPTPPIRSGSSTSGQSRHDWPAPPGSTHRRRHLHRADRDPVSHRA